MNIRGLILILDHFFIGESSFRKIIMKIEIDDNLLNHLNEFLKETSFKNPDELIEFILKDYLGNNQVDSNKEEDKKILEERLKNLGYL